MKKTVICILIIFVMSFIVTGCRHGDITRAIRHAGFTVGSVDFTCSEFLPQNDEDTYYSKIWYLDSSKIITEYGVVYDYILGGEYSNGQSCKQADFTKKVVAILDSQIVKADDGRLYYFGDNGNAPAYSQVTTEDNSYSIYKIIFEDPQVIKAITVDQEAGIYYLLKRDGNVYKYVISKGYNNEPAKLQSSEIVYSKGAYGGPILDFSYSTTSLATNYIRTNFTLYRNIASNREMCEKYEDVQCQYTMRNDTDLFQYMNNVIAYNGGIIITNYGKVFNVVQ